MTGESAEFAGTRFTGGSAESGDTFFAAREDDPELGAPAPHTSREQRSLAVKGNFGGAQFASGPDSRGAQFTDGRLSGSARSSTVRISTTTHSPPTQNSPPGTLSAQRAPVSQTLPRRTSARRAPTLLGRNPTAVQRFVACAPAVPKRSSRVRMLSEHATFVEAEFTIDPFWPCGEANSGGTQSMTVRPKPWRSTVISGLGSTRVSPSGCFEGF